MRTLTSQESGLINEGLKLLWKQEVKYGNHGKLEAIDNLNGIKLCSLAQD